MTFDADLLNYLDAHERARLRRLLSMQRRANLWRPLPDPENAVHPQRAAYESEADVIGYGGAAGGGKTDLICGLSITKHQRVLLLRREKDQTQGIVQRLEEILGSSDGYSSQYSRWKVPYGMSPLIEFGGLDGPKDHNKWKGRPHDLIGLDEATEIRESQARFVLAWCRTSDPKQRCRVLLTFNPPTDAEGLWVIEFFAPWLDPKHPRPAKPGELRWFTRSMDGKRDLEVPDARPFVFDKDGHPNYRFDPKKVKPEHVIRPKSRTFIPARVTDNHFYMESGYLGELQSLPEPLRSQMLLGDFRAGMKDDDFQVIPTRWVEAAMKRWKRPDRLPPMDSIGGDIALGGKDNTVLMPRHGMWFDEMKVYTGEESVDGPTIAGWFVAMLRDAAVIHLDLFGVGAQPYGHLMNLDLQVIGVEFDEKTAGTTANGRLGFFNLRSELWWRMREALDPVNNTGIALPDDRRLKADLCAPKWKKDGRLIRVESRAEIVKRLGRSPDFGTAAILALIDTPKARDVERLQRGRDDGTWDPLERQDKLYERDDERGNNWDPLDRI